MLKIAFCKFCVEYLEEYNEHTFIILQDICEYYILHNKPLEYCGFYCWDKCIDFLEVSGFVLSTECSKTNCLVIPLNLIKIEENSYEYCANECEDEKDFD